MQGSEDGDDAQNFANKGGEALNLDANDDFNDSEDVDDVEEDDNDASKKVSAAAGAKPAAGGAGEKQVKGEKLENQPYDLAVDVNDSEEIESEEEDDEVNMNDVGRSAQATGQTAQPPQQ